MNSRSLIGVMNMEEYKIRIMVVEDDLQIQNFIKYTLAKEGYEPVVVGDGTSALSTIFVENIDLIILDLGLPDVDGLDVIKKVTSWTPIPIIVVSARDQDDSKVAALDYGADDYLTKPFSAVELLARIRVALRHLYKNQSETNQNCIVINDLRIDFSRRHIFLKDEQVHLTPNEYTLLTLLVRNAGKVLTSKTIIKEIWGENYGSDTQALRALMAGLRRKIEDTPGKPRYLLTEIGVGYRLVDE